MSFFNDDGFDSIIRDFFGENGDKRRHKASIIGGEEEDRRIDFSETDEKVYLIFELPGYNEKEVKVVVRRNELEIIAKKENSEDIQDYLAQKLRAGVVISKTLPEFVNNKKFSHTMRNGILEVIFNKK